VGIITNIEDLIQSAYRDRVAHFSHMNDGDVNPTELVAALINRGSSFAEGIRLAQEAIEGSCSMLLLTEDGVFAARDRYGRTPIILGKKDGAYAVAFESCALPNLGYETVRDLGPGEIVFLSEDGAETLRAPDDDLRICSFLWVYYGFPSSTYEGVNVEESRYRSGAMLAKRDNTKVDYVSGVPDSGTGHGLGYAHEARLPFKRPFVKYTPTWSRSFMPPVQAMRDTVAKMKLIPVPEIIRGQRLLFADDSIVRGTQLRDTATMLRSYGAREVHVRVACPPLLFGCKFLNFSRSNTVLELAGRRAMLEVSGRNDDETARRFSNPDSDEYRTMVASVTASLNLTSLQYQRLDDCVSAIGLPKTRLCTYCWDGTEGPSRCNGCCGKC
jgi:amidophosphoribosyltransferase